MLFPELPANEIERLATLRRLRLLETPSDPVFDELVEYAASALAVPFAMVHIIDQDRLWPKSSCMPDLMQTGRDVSFCAHAILAPGEIMEVEDALLDARFWDNPLVIGPPYIRFYAGVPIVLAGGQAVGTVCVIDTKPRQLNEEQRMIMRALGTIAAGEIERQYPPEIVATGH